MKILLVEDDELVVQDLVKALKDQNFVVDVAVDGQEGWELGTAFSYDLVLLDVMLPHLDGITLCRRLRAQGLSMPILLLTAQDTNAQKVMGLDAGADDYVTKPFNVQELLARIRALLRRHHTELPPLLCWENLCLDPSTCEVTIELAQSSRRSNLRRNFEPISGKARNSQPRAAIHLTPKEYGLLELFLRNPHRVYSRSAILDHLWTFEASPGEETVTAHIKGLRQKLKVAGIVDDPIETVYGIGYRLKPKPQKEKGSPPNAIVVQSQSRTASKEHSLETEQQTQAEVSAIWERVKDKFSNRVAVIEQATTALLKARLGEELRHRAQQEAHKLAGSLGMFDLDEGSRLAREMERLFQVQDPLNNEQRLQLSELVMALREELKRTAIRLSEPEEQQPLLLIVSSDSFEELVIEARVKRMRTKVFDPSVAREAVDVHPDVVLLDLRAEGKLANRLDSEQLMLLRELQACTPPVPVLVLGANNLLDRVQVARLGGRRFLEPMPVAQVLEAVNNVLQQTDHQTARVMVVDDDPQVLLALRNLLQPWGIKLTTLNNPLQFWEILEATAPDLLILDIEMPQMSGLDLCQVVRNEPRWANLPVLFLTAHADPQTMQQVFAVGADDYVSKPIVGPELVTRILNRLERSRLHQNRTQIDPLTGVANYRSSTQELARFLDMAQRYGQPLCLAVLHLDRLGQINEQHGHAIANQVLAQFGKLLRQTFQSEDLVARWGGAEFVVGMYAMTRQDGKQRLADVQDKLQLEAVGQPSLQVSFSAGVVQYPQDGATLSALYQVAKERLTPL